MGGKPIGRYVYEKWLCDDVAVPCEVRVFPLKVERHLNSWPEQLGREIRWLAVDDAQALVDEAGLKEVITRFRPRMR